MTRALPTAVLALAMLGALAAPAPARPIWWLTDYDKNDPSLFATPKIGGWFVAWCLRPGMQCGKTASDAFCRSKGFSHAERFERSPHGCERTQFIGTGGHCTTRDIGEYKKTSEHCDCFQAIKCHRPTLKKPGVAPTPRVRPGPKAAPSLQPAPGGVPYAPSLQHGVDFPGGDFAHSPAPSAQACRDVCAKDHRCRAWTWVRPGVKGPQAVCFLKSTVPAPRRDACCVSGVK